jgi:hypothetical protein
MPTRKPTFPEVIARFGGHSAGDLGIDLDDDTQLGRWLVAVCLAGSRLDDALWERSFAELDRAKLGDPVAIASRSGAGNGSVSGVDPDSSAPDGAGRVAAELEAVLRTVKHPDPERVAWKLVRVSAALVEQYEGSLENLAQSADSLEELGGRLAALASGFGTASVTRFLRPLRDRWVEASELPLHPAARAAAVHLGWISDEEDFEGVPSALLAAGATGDGAPFPPVQLRDLEAALERLGSWCRRNRTKTCPLGDECPARRSG